MPTIKCFFFFQIIFDYFLSPNFYEINSFKLILFAPLRYETVIFEKHQALLLSINYCYFQLTNVFTIHFMFVINLTLNVYCLSFFFFSFSAISRVFHIIIFFLYKFGLFFNINQLYTQVCERGSFVIKRIKLYQRNIHFLC